MYIFMSLGRINAPHQPDYCLWAARELLPVNTAAYLIKACIRPLKKFGRRSRVI